MCAGRRGTHLVARLSEFQQHIKAAGLVDTASTLVNGSFAGPVLARPYRDADPWRLLITRGGCWDISDFLGPELLVPFLDPVALRSVPASDQPIHDTTHNDPRYALLRILGMQGACAHCPSTF